LSGVVRGPLARRLARPVERLDLGLPRVAEVDRPVLIDLHARLPAVPEPGDANRGDVLPVLVQHLDAFVSRVGDVDVARGGDRDADGPLALARVGPDGRDDLRAAQVRAVPDDPAVAGVGDPDRAVGPGRDAAGAHEARDGALELAVERIPAGAVVPGV